jgi:hypothetical protein
MQVNMEHETVIFDENRQHSVIQGNMEQLCLMKYSRSYTFNRCPVCYENRDITVQHARKHEARMWGTKERLGIYIAMPSYQCAETAA